MPLDEHRRASLQPPSESSARVGALATRLMHLGLAQHPPASDLAALSTSSPAATTWRGPMSGSSLCGRQVGTLRIRELAAGGCALFEHVKRCLDARDGRQDAESLPSGASAAPGKYFASTIAVLRASVLLSRKMSTVRALSRASECWYRLRLQPRVGSSSGSGRTGRRRTEPRNLPPRARFRPLRTH